MIIKKQFFLKKIPSISAIQQVSIQMSVSVLESFWITHLGWSKCRFPTNPGLVGSKQQRMKRTRGRRLSCNPRIAAHHSPMSQIHMSHCSHYHMEPQKVHPLKICKGPGTDTRPRTIQELDLDCAHT